MMIYVFFFSSRRRHTRCSRDWSSDVCSSDLLHAAVFAAAASHYQSEPVSESPLRPDAVRADRHHGRDPQRGARKSRRDRKSTRLNSSHGYISYAVFCLKKKKEQRETSS